MDFTFEKASVADAETTIGLLSQLYVELGEEVESITFLCKDLINQVLGNGHTEIYIIKVDQQSVGILTLTESQAIYAGGKYGVLDEMYIKPEFRNHNIGTQSIRQIKKIAIERKWHRVDVTAPTDETWEKTVKFYKKCGFVFTGPKLKLQILSSLS